MVKVTFSDHEIKKLVSMSADCYSTVSIYRVSKGEREQDGKTAL